MLFGEHLMKLGALKYYYICENKFKFKD